MRLAQNFRKQQPVRMRQLLTLIALLLVESLFAQVKPDIFPEDVSVETIPIRCFCKPGVRNKSRSKGMEIAYTSMGDGTFNDEEGSLSGNPSQFSRWSKFEFDLKAPVINRDRFKFLLGYKYTSEVFRLGRFGPDYTDTFKSLDETTLKGNSLSAIVTTPLNATKYLGFRLRYSAKGDFGGLMNFEERYAVYKALMVFGIKKNEDFEWGVGLNFSKSFRRTNILPFIIYNRNFLNSWGIETAFPGYFFGRYNLNQSSIMLFGMEYGSDSYRMDVTTTTGDVLDYALNHSELLFLLRLEQRFAPWVWGNLRFGYQMNFSTDFESKALNTTEFMVDPSNGLFFEIGVFISPPDHLIRK